MDGWTGFTDEQLQHLKGHGAASTSKLTHSDAESRRMPNRNKVREKVHQRQHEMEQAPININQMLSAPTTVRKTRPIRPKAGQKNAPPSSHSDDAVEISNHGNPNVNSSGDESNGCTNNEKKKQVDDVENRLEKQVIEVTELNETEGRSRDLTHLEMIQKKQVEMEEENKKKKVALTKAINDRKKRTQAETKQLAFIQRELAKLESLLTKDVSILRDKIESSSFEYNTARSRYEKAEAEFVAAKIHLHKVMERKEALTEHLYTIIQENESRKSKKLVELMDKLNVDNINEYIAAAEKEIMATLVRPTLLTEAPTVQQTDEKNTTTSSCELPTDLDAVSDCDAVKPGVASCQGGLETISEVENETVAIPVPMEMKKEQTDIQGLTENDIGVSE